MSRESVGLWPSSPLPSAEPGRSWPLAHVSELPGVRRQLRTHLVAALDGAAEDDTAAELVDRVVLAFDEMASNALRHGDPAAGGVTARVAPFGDSWLVEVVDGAGGQGPTPAVGRDPGQGGLGLYLIAEMATAHGWQSHGDSKSVWALFPR